LFRYPPLFVVGYLRHFGLGGKTADNDVSALNSVAYYAPNCVGLRFHFGRRVAVE
jgi:hypothetical protein